MDTEMVRRYSELDSRTILRRVQRALRSDYPRLGASQKGSLLASFALYEANGGRVELASDEDRTRFGAFCEALLEPRIDWLKARPCAPPEFDGLCLPVAPAPEI